jgi:hypothetical protein
VVGGEQVHVHRCARLYRRRLGEERTRRYYDAGRGHHQGESLTAILFFLTLLNLAALPYFAAFLKH